ncbi:hypothetical protein NPIL_72221 [Nephila pilipes]|uniref:Uncharacterized protein n=1 Tax=Nephila pilipes TaxID=299642 RepID=A0A8X6NIL6_NEPPI|nr:hypothetical protein NPIL_72221 [Nephila pilipes]
MKPDPIKYSAKASASSPKIGAPYSYSVLLALLCDGRGARDPHLFPSPFLNTPMYPQKIPPDLEPGYYRAHNLKASAIAPEI